MSHSDWDDRQVDVYADEVPEGVRQEVLKLMQPGDTLWRCPSLSGPRGPSASPGIGQRDVVIEWWLLDANGELIEAFWQA